MNGKSRPSNVNFVWMVVLGCVASVFFIAIVTLLSLPNLSTILPIAIPAIVSITTGACTVVGQAIPRATANHEDPHLSDKDLVPPADKRS